jgi:hypothetical protein
LPYPTITVDPTSSTSANASSQPALIPAPSYSFNPIPPEAAQNDGAGHVQGPTGRFVAAHLRFAHGVEEKLETPGCTRQR